MNKREQRKIQMEFLINQIGCEFKDYDARYNEEKISYKCQCGSEKKIDVYFLLSKIKHNRLCNCGIDTSHIDIESFDLENFNKAYEEINEEKKRNIAERKEFLEQEKKLLMKVMVQNRFGILNVFSEQGAKCTCVNKHCFEVNFEELIKGKFCPQCEDNDTFYWTPMKKNA